MRSAACRVLINSFVTILILSLAGVDVIDLIFMVVTFDCFLWIQAEVADAVKELKEDMRD